MRLRFPKSSKVLLAVGVCALLLSVSVGFPSFASAEDAAAVAEDSLEIAKPNAPDAPAPEDGSAFAGTGTDSGADNDAEADAIYDSDDHSMPPNPRHMWSVGNRSEDELIAPLNDFGNRWQGKDFYNALGQLWCSNGKKVVDVSEWEPGIDWQRVRNSGVDGAILRIGLGGGSGKGREDYQFASNLSGVRSVNMPYGVYLYSYAYDADFARKEANFTADLLDKYNCHDLSLPIYYDIEKFDSWSGHSAPSSAAQYEQIIRTYIDTMAARGYTNVEVYTGRAYLQERLNTSYIWSKVSWIAEYGSSLKVTNNLYNGQKGWQYTDSGRVDGIDYDVDMSAFTGFGGVNVTGLSPVSLADGDYYINAVGNGNEGIDIACGSKDSGTRIQLFHANGTAAQKFHFARQSDGSYVITNVNSGLVLDVSGASAYNKAVVQQWTPNDSAAQRWFIRDSGSGYYLQSTLGNWVLDIAGGALCDGTGVTLYQPNGSVAQKFMLASADESSIITDVSVAVTLAENDGFCLDVQFGSKANGAPVQLYSRNGTDAQLFVFKRAGNGVYSIRNVNSEKMLDVVAGATQNNTTVDQYDDNGTAAQRWCVRSSSDGSVTLVALGSGKALDVRSGVVRNGQPVQIYDPNGSAAQRWKVTRALSWADRIQQLFQNNKLAHLSGTYFIASGGNSNRVLDDSGANLSAGANVWLYDKNDSSAQRWEISQDQIGLVTIRNELSGKVLDVNCGNAANGVNIQLWDSNGSSAQKWIPLLNGDGTVTFKSAIDDNFALDLVGASTARGTNVQLYRANNTPAQSFVLAKAPAVLTEGRYTISSGLSGGMLLDVLAGSRSDGANVQLYQRNGTSAQSWDVKPDQGGGFCIANVGSGKALDVCGAGSAPGTNVWQYGANGSAAQRWIPLKNEDGSVVLRSALAPNLVLDVFAGSAVNGSNVQLYTQNGTAAQCFVFKPIK